jgi:hypothetical protein
MITAEQSDADLSKRALSHGAGAGRLTQVHQRDGELQQYHSSNCDVQGPHMACAGGHQGRGVPEPVGTQAGRQAA